MNIDRKTIDIPLLVAGIHAAEAAFKSGWDTWIAYAQASGLRARSYSAYSAHVTGLYTLRARCRGKLHRTNPPAEIRDFNRTMIELGQPGRVKAWNASEHNERIALEVAARFRCTDADEVAEAATCSVSGAA